MSTADIIRIDKFAKHRVRILTSFVKERTHEDLIQETITRVFEKDRTWYKDEVDFLRFFLEAIRSISGHWVDEKSSDIKFVNWEDGTNLDQQIDLASYNTSGKTDQLDNLLHKEAMAILVDKLSGDDEALLVFEELRDGIKGPDIQESLGLDQKEYDTIRKRLFRKLRK